MTTDPGTPQSAEKDHTALGAIESALHVAVCGPDGDICCWTEELGTCAENNLNSLALQVREALGNTLNNVAVGFKPDGWASNQRDQDRLWGIGAALAWLRGDVVTRPGMTTEGGVGS